MFSGQLCLSPHPTAQSGAPVSGVRETASLQGHEAARGGAHPQNCGERARARGKPTCPGRQAQPAGP